MAAAGRDTPGRNSVSTPTATTIASSSTDSSIAERRRRANVSRSSVRLSQPRPSSGRKMADLTISARPYEVDHTCETLWSSVKARPSPESASTQTDVSAAVEKRRATLDRSAASVPALGTTKTSETSPPSQTAADAMWARSTGTAIRLV